ncbi:MAG: alpha-glucosidase [Acidobacteriota bacterium]|nr:alpha-glucosidase [Acidobacteriota bacterium]
MIKKIAMGAAMLFSFCLGAGAAYSQEKKHPPTREWWQNAIFYEIYPRSFADSNNDGIGDLNGITSKLDYLRDLGVDAIWITPCFPSPQVDFGYDVSDYEDIDPMYGTLADFDRLVSEAKKRNIRVLLDFVVNHSSDKHKWFLDSRSSKTSKYRDWYIWRDGKGNNQPPNNWQSEFGGPAWTFDQKTGQYYYNFFYPEQPDLNWRNPAVKEAMLDVTRFWYKRGVSGFRLDAVDTLFEDPNLTDNPILPGTDKFGRPNQQRKFNTKLPEVHDVLQDLRKIADEYDAVLIGETWTKDIAELKQYYGEHSNELQMPMDLMFASVNRLSAPEFRRQIGAVDQAGGWPVFVISNHDIVRSYNRYGDGTHNEQIAKLMASMYLTLRGTPIMYYGEELGMENNNPKSKEDVKDPQGKLGWPKEIGRDGERTPMQWTAGPNAGFSAAKPWLPVPPSYKTHNVESEGKDATSVLALYRQLLALRHKDSALINGKYMALNEDDPNVLAYLRQDNEETILVALNMSNMPQKVSLNLAAAGFASPKLSSLLTGGKPAPDLSAGAIELEPFGVVIAKVTK